MKIINLCMLLALFSHSAVAKLVEYQFDIENTTVNYTGKPVEAMTIDGQIPGPVIQATVGDVLKVTFTNKTNEATSIHWHGVLLPNDQDGVPYLTTPPIKPGQSHTFQFPIKQSGTYWYHSHSGLQEQRGMYGPLIFYPKNYTALVDKELTVVFSDWTNEKPEKVLANLKKDSDYYALKKGSVQSWCRVFEHGFKGVKQRIKGSWSRMGSMDVSDVGYDAFLVNGQTKIRSLDIKKGEKVLLRLINSGTSSYFNIEFSGGPMTVVAADGVDVKPYRTKKLKMAIAETYDVIVSLPENKAYELRASVNDGTGYSSLYLGQGEQVDAPLLPRPDLLMMHHSMHERGYDQLKAITATSLPSNRPWREVNLTLNGNMDRYVWSFNNKPLSEADNIIIKKGENVRFIMENKTMMNHPIHLHGHFFRVLNGQKEYSPLKHTVDVPAMDTVTIEFAANEDKDWFFHCHNLYHMKAGFSHVVSYEESSVLSDETLSKMESDTQFYYLADFGIQSNMIQGMVQASNPKNTVELVFDYDYHEKYDVKTVYRLNISRYFDVYVGGSFDKDDDGEHNNIAIAGFHYMLPLLIEADLRIDHEGEIQFGLSSDLQLTSRARFDWAWDTTGDTRFILNYELSKNLLLTANYDKDFGAGAGIRVRL